MPAASWRPPGRRHRRHGPRGVAAGAPPLLVAGAERDAIVDGEGVEETALFCGVEPRVLRGLAHDVMLASGWQSAADEVIEWYRALPSQ